MSEPTFAPPERRSLLIPILIAVAILACGVLYARHLSPETPVTVEALHTSILPTTTVFHTDTIVIGPNETNSTLLVVSTIRLKNERRVPVYLDDFSLTLTDATGAQLTAKALQKDEIPNLELSFPALKPLAGTPILRETSIDPGKTAEGTVIFSLPVNEALWTKRQSAVVQVDLYHQNPITTTLAK